MARTMTDEQEREIHVYCEAANPAYIGKKLLAELDAERAAHAKTAKMLDALVSELFDAFGWTDTTPLHAVLHAKNGVLNLKADVAAERHELAALKARLALAEAVCGPANEVIDKLLAHGPSIVPHLVDTDDNAGQRLREALTAWRAAK